ncbi:MAG: hypothetical protein A2806_01805 [Candidatus Terrybacteria bacterium RIFCSPHIGHO2_01_FULL_48_17]|uniref:Isoprenylcysteine carboxyl methyltransferase n=1 Tax=Candidatus Terrybacteria bacterium RIFCSPHIGHO2_01_FULL_48_17 TaxID=1802362 RepID=A0A1G2PL84_9BACT|nr:MAG: hypothetical protein A2806_01805 [Candidatus Terrybacteria bacterium RIFCSPHIGHO2_01_FULL_48_17]OHA52657.1 MAG: hypothetical protein A3A30_03490 [Candidatus Terrybacteria bacterium RIFCSPLOWO2_01_FULL_48_14]
MRTNVDQPAKSQQMQPPPSDVSPWTGLVGLVGFALAFFVAFVLQKGLHPALRSIEMLSITGLFMIVFELIRLKNYPLLFQIIKGRLDKEIHVWSARDILMRLLGALITFTPFTIGYVVLKTIMPDRYAPFLIGILISIPIVLLFLAVHFLLTPSQKDVWWQLGMVVLRKQKIKDIHEGAEHWRQWMLKAFFIPFMFGIVYGNLTILGRIIDNFSFELPRVFLVLHMFIFAVDTVFGTAGYVLSFRITDSHIRSTQKSIFGWAVCLICYPPLLFVLFSIADYQDSITWDKWLGTTGPLAWGWALAILLFETLYVWATVIFGLRFSNLTHRGIVTNGPYRYFKHPAYFAKNIAWWLVYIPFIPILSLGVALVNSAQLLFVNYIYYLRARTEEQHLMEDPRYREYAAWIDEHGVLPSLRYTVAKSFAGRFAARLSKPILIRISNAHYKYVPWKHIFKKLL